MLPYSCDAPLYHFPFATIALIVLNTALYICSATGVISIEDGWLLEYGTGVHPVQWLTSRFMHFNFEHLLGNMFFLWAFGLVVEGKLGWFRFLCAYLAIATGQAALEQLVMSGYQGMTPGSLGASAAIFGIMAMACLWAPVNNLSVFFFFYFIIFTFEVSVGVFAAIFVGIDIVMWLLLGSYAGSSILHLMGGMMGAALGFVMLKREMVNCEDYDLLSVMSGDYGSDKKKRREAKIDNDPTRIAAARHEKMLEGKRRFDAYLQIGQPEQAIEVRKRMIDLGMPLETSREQLLAIIVGLHKQNQWAASAPVMAEFLDRFPDDSQGVRLKLSQICLMELDKPNRALDLLEPLQPSDLGDAHRRLHQKITIAANHQIEQGVLEVDDGGW
ncbi:rhomboid family intramembrane serine protease [Adhaeretor mobilis]|uniref:Rhomboid family protein n=1 Tax=Adhaeretor mobilis TaxID=1930276 RepID=A0A517MSH6_9BACT|nr:rhomboid family intramembrane serine protease [Adhaeretor mobilis]QDS97747.1 Rhomboid family protein [Adhaeretor mobilis]